ncbi:hypothetical protein SDC9_105338 [bioreactor metagenome]|uniref:Uncharacterized protein n=1 Tax=bioreactor metagenome TaxID=1076179 RepID=A0A645AZB9_9ZZZZ
MDVPIGTSIIPVFTTCPARANTLVPVAFGKPNPAYHAPPRRKILGILAMVSTLLMMVGFPNNPDWKGKGGFCLGSPLFPSILAMRAVSSPHTKAPAPMRISRANEKSDPKIRSPSKPICFACFIASVNRSMAMGYSARM